MKDSNKKPRFSYDPDKANTTHVTIVAVVGFYLFYLAFEIVSNTMNGKSSMSMTTTVLTAAAMVLIGIACLGYSGYIYLQMRKKNAAAEGESTEQKKGGTKTMEILSVFDEEFKPYGAVIDGYDNAAITKVLDANSPLPEGVEYVPSLPALDAFKAELSVNAYGGMPIELGYCNGHNTKMNCLEYHRDSELNLGVTDFILLLAKRDDIVDGVLDSAKVKAFFCPANVMVEVFATTLHYAPCSANKGDGFKVLIVLPDGTNGPKPAITPKNYEDKLLTACNKWLLAHAESVEATEQGAVVAITGPNIDIADSI